MTKSLKTVDLPGIALEEVISRNIRIALMINDRNQSDLARAFGVSPGTISQKMHGVCAWTIADIDKAGKYLRIDPFRLLDPNGLVETEWGRSGLNRGPADLWSAGPGSKPQRGIMKSFTLAA